MSSENTSELPVERAEPLRKYIRAECVVVYKTKEDWGGLSNMAGGYSVTINGVHILTSEALYQACRFPHLPDVQRAIIEQTSPMTAKMKSKPHRENSRPDWAEVRFKIMRWCLRVKLAQNHAEFGRLLLATRDRPIVEQSRKDAYWGAKLSEDGTELIGENVLGRLLMGLRKQLLEDSPDNILTVEPLPIPDFKLFGRPIDTVTATTKKISSNQPDLYKPREHMGNKYLELSELAVAYTKHRFETRARAQIRAKQVVEDYAAYLKAPTADIGFCRLDGNLERTGETVSFDDDVPLVLGKQGLWHFCFSIKYTRSPVGHFVTEWTKLSLRETGTGTITIGIDGKDFEVDSLEPSLNKTFFDHLYELSKAELSKSFEEPSRRIGFLSTD